MYWTVVPQTSIVDLESRLPGKSQSQSFSDIPWPVASSLGSGTVMKFHSDDWHMQSNSRHPHHPFWTRCNAHHAANFPRSSHRISTSPPLFAMNVFNFSRK